MSIFSKVIGENIFFKPELYPSGNCYAHYPLSTRDVSIILEYDTGRFIYYKMRPSGYVTGDHICAGKFSSYLSEKEKKSFIEMLEKIES